MNYRKTVKRIIMAITAFGILAIAIASCATSRVNASDEPAKHDIAFAEPKYTVYQHQADTTIKTVLMPMQRKQDQQILATGKLEDKVDKFSQILAGQLRNDASNAELKASVVSLAKLAERQARKTDSLFMVNIQLKRVVAAGIDSITTLHKAIRVNEEKHQAERQFDHENQDVSARVYNLIMTVLVWGGFAITSITLIAVYWVIPYLRKRGVLY